MPMSMRAGAGIAADAVLWSGMRAAHSTEGPAGGWVAELRVWVRNGRAALAAAALLAAAAQTQGQDTAWRDLESRIQYGYYTEDAAALRGVATTLGDSDAHDKLHGYYAGLLEWRLALLAARPGAPAHGPSAAQLTQRCVSDLDGALALDADFADALALRSACLATALTGSGVHVPFAAYRARKDLERAAARCAHRLRARRLPGRRARAAAAEAAAHGGRLRGRAPRPGAVAGLGRGGGLAAAGARAARSWRPARGARCARARPADRAAVSRGAAADGADHRRLRQRRPAGVIVARLRAATPHHVPRE